MSQLLSLWDFMKAFEPVQLMAPLRVLFELSNPVQGTLETRMPGAAVALIQHELKNIANACKKNGLPVSKSQAERVLDYCHEFIQYDQMQDLIAALATVVEDECKARLYFAVESRYFEDFRDGWEEALKRFPELLIDVEEMGKCHALGRCAGTVFHSVHAAETLLIKLGAFIGVSDPKSGWTATANALEKIIKKKYEDRSDFEKQHYAFLEQVHGTVEALKNAWRNKVSHAQGRLVLLTVDFGDKVAEEIMIATRAFARRIATEMPQ